LKKGQTVETAILHVDREAKRISLGLKQVQPDPWEMVPQKYPVGSNVKGKVVRLADFGAFIELEPGVDGLLHISQMSSRPVNRPEDMVQVGDELTLKVIRVDPNERRIGLSLRELAADLLVVEEQEHHGRRGGRRRERDRYDDDDDE
jgi:ribosomal protein S1